ncbi:hypothetical protein TNCV_1581051 [Trichonephila clavipes]|nr:hypothetical protein TNCV_1581051 [Trichonephila clavipes]
MRTSIEHAIISTVLELCIGATIGVVYSDIEIYTPVNDLVAHFFEGRPFLQRDRGSSNHDRTSTAARIGGLTSSKIPYHAGDNVYIIGWTSSAKMSLYFSPVIVPFRVAIGPAENHDISAPIITEPPSCLEARRR